MNHPLRGESLEHLTGVSAVLLLVLAWFHAFTGTPVDALQGEAYRIIYIHVPAAATAFTAAALLAIFSMWGLLKGNDTALFLQRAAAEVGLLFTVATLATGSIWGRPIWGVWWTWDARLTTTLLLAILFFGYLVLYTSLTPGAQRTKACSLLGIVIFVDVPIIYQSVNWWRTLHQPQSIIRKGGSTMDPDMLQALIYCLVPTLCLGIWLIIVRTRNLMLSDVVETMSHHKLHREVSK